MTTETRVRIELSREDNERVSRLTEEIRGRLLELALIASRVGGGLDPAAKPKFVLRKGTISDLAAIPDIEIIDLPDGTHCCLINLGAGFLFECPCGSAV